MAKKKENNNAILASVREDALKQIQRLHSPHLIAANEAFHQFLAEGITVTYQKDGTTCGEIRVRY